MSRTLSALAVASALALMAEPLRGLDSGPGSSGPASGSSAPTGPATLATAAALRERVSTVLLEAAPGGEALLPAGSRVVEVATFGDQWIVRLELPAELLDSGLSEERLEELSRRLDLALPERPDLRRLHLVARPLGDQGPFAALTAFLDLTPTPRKELQGERLETSRRALLRRALVRREGAGAGPLAGMLIFLSQCHGFLDYGGATGWSTQRGVTHSIVEDFVNPEALDQYLIEYLERAGATVLTARERDLQSAMVIVDEADGSADPTTGTAVESGDPAAFSPSGQTAFGHGGPWSPSANPFAAGTARLLATSPSETARLTWTPNLPADGTHWVYVSYTRDGANRASDAHYIVRHAGGETHVRVDQERHGWTWIPLGRFHFPAGHDPLRGSVALANDSIELGESVSADAVRFGGGMGDVLGENLLTLSGRPRWEEGARSYLQYLGAPPSVWGAGDVSGRSKWAAWEHFAGEDSLYLSWHSNAFDGSARGTTTYVYSANPPDGTYDPTQSVPGSDELAAAIHDEIVGDVRAAWDPAWQDRGLRSAYFGEINPSHNGEMPSTLLEVAFHDNATDAAQLAHPRFRRLLARAIAQGIVKWVAARDGVPVALQPEPPAAPEVHATGPTSAVVTWSPSPADAASGDPATGYRLYASPDGYGFDDGVAVSGTSHPITDLTPGEIRYLRLTATNDGGESLPTATLVVRAAPESAPRVLMVDGFDRLDSGLLVREGDPDLGAVVARMLLGRMNDGSAGVPHAAALATLEVGLDSSTNDAVLAGRVTLDPAAQPLLVWVLGEESTADETFSSAEQALVAAYLAAGGRLLVSGAELGWDLDHLGSAADRDFLRLVLGARYLADDGGTNLVEPVPGGVLDGMPTFGFERPGGPPIEYPDVLEAEPGGARCLHYAGGGDPACVVGPRAAVLGFPFEGVHPPPVRDELIGRLLEALRIPGWPLFADGFESGNTTRWSSARP